MTETKQEFKQLKLVSLPQPRAAPISDKSHYVLYPYVIAGSIPSHAHDAAERERMAKALVVAGVTDIVNLIAERVDFHPYEEDVRKENNTVLFHYFPVPDASVFKNDADLVQAADLVETCVKSKRVVYIHCWGGHGRTGLLCTVWLARHFRLDYWTAIKLNNDLHTVRMRPGKRRASPNRAQQVQALRVIESAHLFDGGELSQFWKTQFVDYEIGDKIVFRWAEQYMMYRKAKLFGDNDVMQSLLKATTPFECKGLGRQVKGFKEEVWNKHREAIVERGNLLKFSQNEELKRVLLATAPHDIYEARKDKNWGINLTYDDALVIHRRQWNGTNLLGKCLVKVRTRLATEAASTIVGSAGSGAGSGAKSELKDVPEGGSRGAGAPLPLKRKSPPPAPKRGTSERIAKRLKTPAEIKEYKGDLFGCPEAYALAHCVSRDLEMGKGIAVEFKRKFASVDVLRSQDKAIGDVAVLECKIGAAGTRFVYNLVTKEHYWDKPTYESLEASLKACKYHCVGNKVANLAIPRLGCGLDGLAWPRVREMIECVFAGTKVVVHVYVKP